MIDYRVHRTATLARGVVPAAFVVVDQGAVIEEGVTLGVGCYIGPNVTIRKGAAIGPHCVILTDVPAGVTIAPNTTLGSVAEARQRERTPRGKAKAI